MHPDVAACAGSIPLEKQATNTANEIGANRLARWPVRTLNRFRRSIVVVPPIQVSVKALEKHSSGLAACVGSPKRPLANARGSVEP
jgi:hypothetical protein